MSLREIMLAWITAVIVLFGLTWWWYWQPHIEEWKTIQAEEIDYRQRLAVAEHLLSKQEEWDTRLEDVKKNLPSFRADQEVTADFLKLCERLAGKHGVVLLRARPSPEEPAGDLYQMTINYSWEGDLTSLVHFLYALQNEQANLDVQQISVSPDSREPRKLKGSLAIDFAYTRENG